MTVAIIFSDIFDAIFGFIFVIIFVISFGKICTAAFQSFLCNFFPPHVHCIWKKYFFYQWPVVTIFQSFSVRRCLEALDNVSFTLPRAFHREQLVFHILCDYFLALLWSTIISSQTNSSFCTGHLKTPQCRKIKQVQSMWLFIVSSRDSLLTVRDYPLLVDHEQDAMINQNSCCQLNLSKNGNNCRPDEGVDGKGLACYAMHRRGEGAGAATTPPGHIQPAGQCHQITVAECQFCTQIKSLNIYFTQESNEIEEKNLK